MVIFIIFLLVFFTYSKGETPGCCYYQTGSKSSDVIDLKYLSGHVFDFNLTFEADHKVTLTVCEQLQKEHECKLETKTNGPSNMKDDYKTETCYTVGNRDNCEYNKWDANTKTAMLTYTGHLSDEDPPRIRSVEFTTYCDETITKVSKTQVECQSVDKKHETHYIYHCSIRSAHCCPGYARKKDKSNAAATTFLVLLLLCCCFCCCGLLVVGIAVVIGGGVAAVKFGLIKNAESYMPFSDEPSGVPNSGEPNDQNYGGISNEKEKLFPKPVEGEYQAVKV